MKSSRMEKQWRVVLSFDRRNMVSCTLKSAEQLLADFPDFWPGWVCYGASLYAVARYREALFALRKALAGYPQERRHFVQSQFGHLYSEKGDFRRAKDWFRKTIESAPSEASGYIYLGAVLAREGRFAEAEKIHRQGTQCTTGCIDEAYFNLGLVLRAQGRFSEALECFRKALEIEPKDKSVKRALIDVSHAMKLKKSVTPSSPRPK